MFFFFKQKTAYELRISDWSSDVCSSDLGDLRSAIAGQEQRDLRDVLRPAGTLQRLVDIECATDRNTDALRDFGADARFGKRGQRRADMSWRQHVDANAVLGEVDRSEEHTSELQSLMRISYAVFCLKKKNY